MWSLRYDSKTVPIWLTILFLKYPIILDKPNPKNGENIYSSVWCFPSEFGNRCSFNNICYHPKFNSFLFIIGKGTVISGITSTNELKEISTSWLNHSYFHLKLAMVDNISEYKLIKGRTIIFSRFKPDNIMHVIHDDLLPLYVTYKRICFGNVTLCSTLNRLVFVDTSFNHFHRLYGAFSNKSPITLSSVNSVVCFSQVLIGLDSESIFYQYGYNKPQGSVMPHINGELIYEFSDYILKYLKINRITLSKCTLIGRQINRKILNEKYLIELIKDVHLKKTNESIFVNNLDVKSHSIEQLIESVAKSKLLLGMHGAGMILSIFLPPASMILELFPYGIIKENVSPVYSLSKIVGIHFGYMSWTNRNKENSLSHPEYPPLLGGFEMITDAQKERILVATFVPPVYCCHDPLYLHFMYQDTYIDYSIVAVLSNSFESYKSEHGVELLQKRWYFPSNVINLNCSHNDTNIMFTWDPPVNLKKRTQVIYNITISSPLFNSSYVTKSSFINVKFVPKVKFISVWVKGVVNEIEGVDTHFICSIKK